MLDTIEILIYLTAFLNTQASVRKDTLIFLFPLSAQTYHTEIVSLCIQIKLCLILVSPVYYILTVITFLKSA